MKEVKMTMFGEEVNAEPTLAQQVLFRLQLMGFMMSCGREDEANKSFQKAQELAQQLIDAGH